MTEEVIELSINETQALRAKLGLPPLRGQGITSNGGGGQQHNGGGSQQQHPNNVNNKTNDNKEEELVLSIDETNSLRAKIGLPPLKSSSSSNNSNNNGIDGENNKKAGTSSSTAIHVPPPNTDETNQVQKRIEDAAAKRDATDRIKLLECENAAKNDDNGGRGESALDFAAKMLRGNTNTKQAEGKLATSKKKKKKKKKKKMLSNNPQLSLPSHDDEEDDENNTNKEYTSADLHGIKVSHDLSEFESGTTTVLTLADKSILNVDTTSTNKVTKLNENNEMNELINVNMDNDKQSILNLKKKRAIELGAGRAGGYAGYDDDEFDELGGIGITVNGGSGMMNHNDSGGGGAGASTSNKKGFEIGKTNINTETTNNNKSNNSDLFTSGSINLQSRYTSKVASDFMTSNDIEEEEGESREMKLEKERKKQAKILNKLRKKKDKKLAKKAKKKRRRRKGSDDDDDDDSDNGGIGERVGEGGGDGSLLLANLEATAVGSSTKDDHDVRKKKRRRHGEDDEDDVDGTNEKKEQGKVEEDDDNDIMTEKRKRFDMIMEKGKSRTDRAFNRPSIKQLSSRNNDDNHEDADDNGDDDDAFLNAALAKARRLKRLKELSGSNNDTKVGTGISGNNIKREDVVVQAVARSKQEEEEKAAAAAAGAREGTTGSATGGKDNGGITFEFDEMQEFTRALRAREDQAKRNNNNVKGRGVKATVPGSNNSSTKDVALKSIVKEEETDGPVKVVEDVTMEELAQEMEDNDNNETNDNEEDNTLGGGAFGNTAESAPIGRGMSSFLSMLKHTGEIKNHATKEEMRGRAKDKRTYEDYEQLDLQKVVNVDTHRHNAHEKDIELANREIKLEYRDDFGRLLTRKEAYRDMCYQFHGHGSSKKNQERRLKQIEREREEGTLASRGTAGVGTLGALKATQKATGKAFIIHKT